MMMKMIKNTRNQSSNLKFEQGARSKEQGVIKELGVGHKGARGGGMVKQAKHVH